MPIDVGMVCGRLKEARKLQGLPLEAVQQETGIASGRLAEIEAGNVEPTGDEVLILAAYYRHDFRDFIDSGRPSPFKETDILYRKHGDVFSTSDRRSVQEFLFLCEAEAELEAELGIRKSPFSYTPVGTYFKAHGEAAASALRHHLGYQEREIRPDVFDDFRTIGVHLFRRRLESSDISGLFIEHPIAGHCVLINYEEDIYRQRFSAAHEIAHVIFDASESVTVTFDQRSTRYDRADLNEVRANRFASCYLMPPELLPKGANWTTDSVVDFAHKLRVSTTALAIALKETGIVDGQVFELIRSVRLTRQDKVEPEAPASLNASQLERRRRLLEMGMSDYYVGLCFEGYQRGVISSGRLAEILLTDRAGLSEVSVLYGRALRHEL